MRKIILSIAASDPSGGAGIEADLKVFTRIGVFGLTAITGITVQEPEEIKAIIPTPIEHFRAILEIHFKKLKPDAVKIGAIATKEHLEEIKSFLEKMRVPAVLDTILLSSTGFELLEKSAWGKIKELFSLVSLITPNIEEAEILSGTKIQNNDDKVRALKILNEQGAKAILLKGGHLKGEPEDWLWLDGSVRLKFSRPRVAGKIHGTGCALSSAIASYLALGYELELAVKKAEEYLDRALYGLMEISQVKYFTHLEKEDNNGD